MGCVPRQLARNVTHMGSTTTARIASLLRAEAARQNLSTAEISRRTGMAYETTRRKMYAQGALTVDELTTFSDALGIDPAAVIAQATLKGRAA